VLHHVRPIRISRITDPPVEVPGGGLHRYEHTSLVARADTCLRSQRGLIVPTRLNPLNEEDDAWARACVYNTIRLHQGVGYVTPEDEHTGRGETIRAARRAGLRRAHEARLAARRQLRQDHP
jgi:hypothetical protein